MGLLMNVLVRLHSTMFTLYMVPQIFIDIVNSATTDPETAPDVGRAARLFQGGGRVSAGLECWHGAAGFFEDTHAGRMKAAFLIAIFLLISAFIIVTRWGGCWKTGADPGSLKLQQKGLKAEYSGIQASSTTAADRGPSNWTVSIPLSTTTTWSDLAFKVPTIPTSPEESLQNRFPGSNFTIGVYTGFTTGVGPRR